MHFGTIPWKVRWGSEHGCEILPSTLQILMARVDPSTAHQSALDVVTLSVTSLRSGPLTGMYQVPASVELRVSGCEFLEGRAMV